MAQQVDYPNKVDRTKRFGMVRAHASQNLGHRLIDDALHRMDVLMEASPVTTTATATPSVDTSVLIQTGTGFNSGLADRLLYSQGSPQNLHDILPREGMTIYVQTPNVTRLYSGTAWVIDTLTTLAADLWTAGGGYSQTELQDAGDKLDEVILALQKMGLAK